MRLSIEFVWTTRATQNIFSYMQCWLLPVYMNSYYYQESQVLESGSNFMIVKILNLRCDYQKNLCECREQRNTEGISVFSLISFSENICKPESKTWSTCIWRKVYSKRVKFSRQICLKIFLPCWFIQGGLRIINSCF